MHSSSHKPHWELKIGINRSFQLVEDGCITLQKHKWQFGAWLLQITLKVSVTGSNYLVLKFSLDWFLCVHV